VSREVTSATRRWCATNVSASRGRRASKRLRGPPGRWAPGGRRASQRPQGVPAAWGRKCCVYHRDSSVETKCPSESRRSSDALKDQRASLCKREPPTCTSAWSLHGAFNAVVTIAAVSLGSLSRSSSSTRSPDGSYPRPTAWSGFRRQLRHDPQRHTGAEPRRPRLAARVRSRRGGRSTVSMLPA